MIKRVISADNVMDTALVRLFVERGLQQLGQIANVTEQGNKGSLTYYVPLLNYNLDMYVLIFHIIRIILCLLNVLHLISSAGSPFVTLWQSITRELSLCGNLSRAQRRVSVTAQLAPRAGGPQVATGGTVRIHSDTGSLLRASNHPGERPAERANGVTTGRQLQVAAAVYGRMVYIYGVHTQAPSTSGGAAAHHQRPLLRRSLSREKLT